MKQTYTYPAVFYKEDNGYTIIFPDFGGASQGDNLDDAMYNAQEFLDSIVAYYMDENIPLPQPTDMKNYEHDPIFKNYDYITTLVRANPLRFSQKKVRKNVTIPEYLNLKAEEDHLNISRFLTDELAKIYG